MNKSEISLSELGQTAREKSKLRYKTNLEVWSSERSIGNSSPFHHNDDPFVSVEFKQATIKRMTMGGYVTNTRESR